jgi:antitoxin component of RelBE/YafQ-DinJ toxin-antitoxin module
LAKSKFLQIRVSDEEKARIERAARAHYIDTSTWVRMTVMRAVDNWEGRKERREKAEE